MDKTIKRARAIKFRELHGGPHILVLPNAWDAASAKIFEQSGFAAVGTTSAGIAAVFGYADGEQISRREVLMLIGRIAQTVELPVSADIEAGYGGTLAALGRTIEMVITAGAVGINLEDSTQRLDKPLADLAFQVDKLKTVREVAAELGVPLFINARTDVYLRAVGKESSRFGETVHRANAYREAGSDCSFIIGVQDRETIAALVREIDGPVNVLATAHSPSISELEQLGVKRVSFGSGPMRATLSRIREIAQELSAQGTYNFLTPNTPSHAEVNRLFE